VTPSASRGRSGDLEHRHASAGPFDLRARRRGERVRDDEERRRQVPATEHLQRLVQRAHEANGAQDILVDRDRRGLALGMRVRFERTALGGSGDRPDVHDLVLELEAVAEAAQFRDAPMERRLTALEPRRNRATGACLLALRAATGGLAFAGGDAAAHAGLRRS
jgi:hypothetical protein